MRRESHVRFCEGPGGKLPRATRRNVYVRSKRAGERVMQGLRGLYAKLRLRVNESKSAVARAWERKLLGFSFWIAPGKAIRCRVAPEALRAMKERVREITRRNGGRSLGSVIAELRSFLVGWHEYFQLAKTPGIFADLDKWIRRRLRLVQLKQWKRGTTAYRELRARGVPHETAARAASHIRRWWLTSKHEALNIALTTRSFDRLGVPRLAH